MVPITGFHCTCLNEDNVREAREKVLDHVDLVGGGVAHHGLAVHVHCHNVDFPAALDRTCVRRSRGFRASEILGKQFGTVVSAKYGYLGLLKVKLQWYWNNEHVSCTVSVL